MGKGIYNTLNNKELKYRKEIGIVHLSIHIFKNDLYEPCGWKVPTGTHERFPEVLAGFSKT